MRLFVAVTLPTEISELVEQEVVTGLRSQMPTVRWVPESQRHITVKFMADVADEQVDSVASRVQAVGSRHAPVEVELGEVGCFPDCRSARVIWIAVRRGSRELASLARDLDAELQGLAEPDSQREFVPHLTVGRTRTPESVAFTRSLDLPVFTFTAITLFSSTFRPGLKTGTSHHRIVDAVLGGEGR